MERVEERQGREGEGKRESGGGRNDKCVCGVWLIMKY